MDYYNKPDTVEAYVRMAEGYDGHALIRVLQQHLPAGSTVLELGMGPGKDLDLLLESYIATGSDLSPVFLDRYRREYPMADLLELDARTIKTRRHFGAVYSNKVLHHLTRDELVTSLQRQLDVLEPHGLAMHSFWRGTGTSEDRGMLSTYYSDDELYDLVPAGYQVLAVHTYREIDDDDSIYLLLRKVE